jgi:alpha-D-ribose 1-methylphosphonate 5-phosphate C-P lyase
MILAHRRDHQFAFLDAVAKKEIRRAAFKAVCIPGHQVPYSSREMPISRGFGTGGLQLTLALIGPGDVVKVIDQGSDESVNAVNLRDFIESVAPGVGTTTHTSKATLIQSRHRIPEHPLGAEQILILQVPYPCPLSIVEPSERIRRRMHAESDYARLWVKLYEDLVRFKEITISNRYPAIVHGRYMMDPSPIPRWDLPKMHQGEALILLGAGREKKIYAVPPHTSVVPLQFDDVPFRVEDFTLSDGTRAHCALCDADDTYLDEIPLSDGAVKHQCSDLDWCRNRRGLS